MKLRSLMGGTRGWRGTILAALSLCALSPAIFAQNTGTTIRRHKVAVEDPLSPPELAQAEAAIQKNDYATAEPLLKKIVDENPANYQAWFDLGFVNNAQGKTDESIAAYRKSVAAKPDVFESNLNLGFMLAKAKQPEAEQYLRAATTLKPTAQIDEGHARAWLGLARVLEPTKPEEAIAAYKQAATLRPKDTEPHLAAGILLEQGNQFADAQEQYEQALAIDPTSSDAITALANLYMKGHKFDKAEEMLRKLLVARPDDPMVHLQLGRVLTAAGKYDEGLTELEAGIKAAPSDPAGQRDLGDLYFKAGKYDKAEVQYRALVATAPKDVDLHLSLGQTYVKLRKFPEAQQEFLTVVKLKPDFAAAYADLAGAAHENGNYPLALQALDARAKFLPELPITYFIRATAYDHLHDAKAASLNYHKFLEVDNGQFPDHEWQARHRLIAIEPKK